MNKRKASVFLAILFFTAFILAAFNSTAYSQAKRGSLKSMKFSMESISIYNGVFGKDRNNHDVFYGTTIMGNNSTNFFIYDINENQVVKNINIQGISGSNIVMNYDGNIYFGTYSRATIYKYNIQTEELTKLAQLPGEEVTVCDFKIYDGKMYIGTYPDSKVYILDLSTNKLASVGSMFDLNYANTIEYDDATGKIYAGIGPKAHLIEYDTVNKVKHEIDLPDSTDKDTFVYMLKKVNNKIFIGVIPSNKVYSYNLDTKEVKVEINRIGAGFNRNPSFTPNNVYFTGMVGNIFAYDTTSESLSVLQHNAGVKIQDVIDSSHIATVSQEGLYTETDFAGRITKKIDLVEAGLHGPPALPMFSYASTGTLYFGGKRMAIYDTLHRIISYRVVPGEPKVIIYNKGDVYTANYTDARIWKYDVNILDDKTTNLGDPKYLASQIANQNRPLAMLMTPDESKLIIATDPSYGEYGSSITVFNTNDNTYRTNGGIVGRQSVKCMTLDSDSPNFLYIGTSNRGTYGNKVLNESAHVIKYDIANNKIVYDVIPDKRSGMIRAISYSNGNLYFIGSSDNSLYSINTKSFKTVKILKKSGIKDILSSVDGNLYGISDKALYTIDKTTLKTKKFNYVFNNLNNLFEDRITNKLYFFDDSSLYSLE